MTKTMWVLIGYGPMGPGRPALFWSDKEKALAACAEIFGEPGSVCYTGDPTWDCDKVAATWGSLVVSGNTGINSREVIEKLYLYGGFCTCGPCERFVLKEIEEGKPFVGCRD